jgi:branched-chain amino acid transport system permease protein
MTRRRLMWGALIVAVAVAAGVALPEFYVTLLNYIGLYTLVVLGLVLLTGVGGLTSFGQAAFVGLAAYATAYLTSTHGASPWLGLAAGIVVTMTVAGVIAAVTLRLSAHYLPLGTMAWGISIYYLFGNLNFLGGYTGISDVPPVQFFGAVLDTGREFFYLIWATVLVSLLAVSHLLDSRLGRAIRALRGGQQMAASFGVDIHRIKVLIFLYSAFLACLSGWLYAHLLRFVNPTPFGLGKGIEYLFMAVVGGAGFVWGAVAGAGILTILEHALQDLLPRLFGHSGSFDRLVFGVMMVVLLHYAREGAMHQVQKFWPSRRRSVRSVEAVPALAPALPARDKPAPGTELLKVDGISKNFGGLKAVNAVSFSVNAGEIVGLIGPNGAGKSTVFNLVTGSLALNQGGVGFRGVPISGRPARDIAALGMARSFQHANLLGDMSVIENVMLGAHLRGASGLAAATLRIDREEEASLCAEAAHQLQRVGLADYADELAGNLALGQQRLLEIARALCADPYLILLDEPAAGLRLMEKQALATLLGNLREEGLGILLVEHDMDFVMNLVDRLVVMDFGQKIAEGMPEDIQRNAAVIEAYLGGLDDDEQVA